ncbi:MAG: Ig-like domain-containing protein [Actinomycetia bacterium]|nr:Ig-like domain-containing protein [Actinomycetes bacterium]
MDNTDNQTVRTGNKKARLLSRALAVMVSALLAVAMLPAVAFAAPTGGITPAAVVGSVSLPTLAQAQMAMNKVTDYQAAVLDLKIVGYTHEWTVMDLARAGKLGDAARTAYLTNLAASVASISTAPKLHNAKATENERVILTLTACGVDATKFNGYDMTAPLADFNFVKRQGINGSIWALIALDTGNYPMPQLPAGSTAIQASRESLIAEILRCEIPGGGWSLTYPSNTSNLVPDPDVTAMTLQAFTPYYGKGNSDLDAAVMRALSALSAVQKADGSFMAWGDDNLESAVQVLVAMNGLGIPLNDERFVKGGKTLYDVVTPYQLADGSFKHVATTGSNGMATEQGSYGLISLVRSLSGKGPLYDMSDVTLAAWPASGTIQPAQKDDLTSAAAAAQAAVAGKSAADFSAESWAAYQSALTAAQAALDKPGATQAEVDAALAVLKAATAGLKAASVAVTSVAISGAPASYSWKATGTNQPLQLKVDVAPSNATNKSVTWATSNVKLATVSTAGLVTFTGSEGTVRITVKSVDGAKTDYQDIKVVKNVTKVLTPLKTVYMQVGKKHTIGAVAYDGSKAVSAKLTWKSSNTKVATVSSKGVVTMNKKAKNNAKATITATAADGTKLSVNVVAAKNAAALKKATATAPTTLKVGAVKTIAVKLGQPKATWTKITFKSSKAAGLTVDAAGTATAKKKGTYKVTITIDKVRVVKTIKVK